MFGRMLNEKLGKWTFWLMFVGFNLTFMPQHFVGLLGMPRRVYTYTHGGLWEAYNLTSTIGAGVMAVGMLLFFINVFTSRSGKRAGQRPVARRHARVVRVLAAAAGELHRAAAVRDLAAAAARPAPAAEGARCSAA